MRIVPQSKNLRQKIAAHCICVGTPGTRLKVPLRYLSEGGCFKRGYYHHVSFILGSTKLLGNVCPDAPANASPQWRGITRFLTPYSNPATSRPISVLTRTNGQWDTKIFTAGIE